MEGIRGGHIEHGLLMGLASSGGCELLSSYGGSLSYAEQVVANAVLGGVVSELGGGKFANGAMTAAYTMMFNDLAHKKRHRLFMRSNKYKSTHPQWRKEVRKQAFEYMLDYSNKTGNEIAAVVLENGNILVFDPTGNDPTNSNNYFADEKVQKLTDNSNNNNILNNINNTDNNVIQISLKDISDTFYSKIKTLYTKFNSAGDSLYRFTDYMNIQSHFNNFFNNLFVYGSEDTNMLDYSLCNIHCVDEMLNNFIKDSELFLNSEKIRAYSDYHIYKNF